MASDSCPRCGVERYQRDTCPLCRRPRNAPVGWEIPQHDDPKGKKP
jgi:hypothetical protein